MLLLSYSVGLVPLDPAQVLALRGFERVAFKRPVRIGDTIRVEGGLDSKRELDAASGLAVFNWKIVNQRDEVVALAKAQLLWRRAPDVALAAPQRDEVYL
jgi:acyl dehydratase